MGCRLPKTQSANRRAAVGRADQRLIRVGRAVLETLQQRIGGGQEINSETTIGAINEVGTDAGQFRLLEPAQGQRTQLLVSRMDRQ
jgi:hypothetical protein